VARPGTGAIFLLKQPAHGPCFAVTASGCVVILGFGREPSISVVLYVRRTRNWLDYLAARGLAADGWSIAETATELILASSTYRQSSWMYHPVTRKSTRKTGCFHQNCRRLDLTAATLSLCVPGAAVTSSRVGGKCRCNL